MNGRVPVRPVFLTTCLLALAGLASGWALNVRAQGQERRSAPAARTLRLPEIPYRYTTSRSSRATSRRPAAQRFDNTPADNPIDRRRRDARPRALLRHAAVGQQHGLLRLLPRADARLRRSQPLQPRVQGRADRPPRDEPGQPAVPPAGRFFWDERGGNLEAMVLLPVQNRLEMGQDLGKLPAMLAARAAVCRAVSSGLRRRRDHRRAHRAGARAVPALDGVVPVAIRRGPLQRRVRRATTSPTSRCRRTAARRCSCAIARSAICPIRTRTS